MTIDPTDWQTIEPRYSALRDQPLSPAQVPGWLEQWSALESLLYEAEATAYRATLEDTTNKAAEQRYSRLVTEIKPQARLAAHALKQKLLALHDAHALPDNEMLLRHFQAEVALFNEENLRLQAAVDVRSKDYNAISGRMTAVLDGEELTLSAIEDRLLLPEREARETAWTLMTRRRLQDKQALDDLFLDLLRRRRELARNAGMVDYRAYRWQELKRFDYTPDDCLALHRAIEEAFVPLWRRLCERRQAALGVPTLRSWDLAVDPLGRPPLRPFGSAAQLEEGVARILARLDPAIAAQFARLRGGDLDLESRKGKAPGGYCDIFPASKRAYIFMNAVGSNQDVLTLIHEAGHTFHFLTTMETQRLLWNVLVPMEIAEVASMGLVALCFSHLSTAEAGLYQPEEARRAVEEELETIVYWFLRLVAGDAFQHWLYSEAPEDVTATAIHQQWDSLMQRFLPGVDWTGWEEARAASWQRTLHFYLVPFYYIEYVLAQLAALDIWRAAQHDERATVTRYRSALALGSSRPLAELYAVAGTRLHFEPGPIREIAAFVADQLDLDAV